MKSLCWITLGAALAANAWAEGPCPPGQRMVGHQNVRGSSFPICQPFSDYGDGGSQPRVVWEDRWGAIVFDSTTGSVGTVVGYSGREDAIRTAMTACKADGGTEHCQLRLAYRNQCAAGAWGPGNNGLMSWYRHPKREGAEERAIASCVEGGGGNCRLLYSECSLQERVQ